MAAGTFNRTIVELKSKKLEGFICGNGPFNRTIVELKYVPLADDVPFVNLLIVP